ncbi:MAG: porin [Betaproteobacteria bacterium]|nr:porin [Betaproteobacteria bacterium]
MASEADVLNKIEALQKEIDALKAQVQKVQAEQKAPAPAATGAPLTQNEVATWRKWFAAVPTGEAPATSARTGATIYGRFDLGYESNYDGAISRKVLNSYSSRIGFKGTRILTEDLTGVMQIETGVAPDDNANSGTWGSRETYAGIRSGTFGTTRVGKIDSPFKDLEGYGSPMWGSGEQMEVIVHGKGTAVASGSTWANFHTRYTNVIQYGTPVWANTQARLAYQTDEVNGAPGTVKKPSWAGSVDWDNGAWEAGFAYQNTNNFNGMGKDLWGYKFSAGGKLGDATLGFLWSRLDNDVGKSTDNWSLAGTYKVAPKIVLKASYAASSETANGANDGIKMVALEADYLLDKHTALYAYYSKITNDALARGRFAAGENTYSPAAGLDPSVFAIAIRYNF